MQHMPGMSTQCYEFIPIILGLEALTIPAWIWSYNEIKRQEPYEPISSDQEEQLDNRSRRSRRHSRRRLSSSSDEGISDPFRFHNSHHNHFHNSHHNRLLIDDNDDDFNFGFKINP